MERDVYTDPRVMAALKGYTLIAADVSDTDAQSRELLDRFQLFGPPSLLFFDQGTEIRAARIQGEASASELADHLNALSEWQTS